MGVQGMTARSRNPGIRGWRFLAFLGVLFALAPAAQAHRLGAPVSRTSTAYCGCEGRVGEVDSKGHSLRWGHVAANGLPYGTLLRMEHLVRVPGQRPRRYFRVKDSGAPMDIWVPERWQMNAWGNSHVLTYRVVVHAR